MRRENWKPTEASVEKFEKHSQQARNRVLHRNHFIGKITNSCVLGSYFESVETGTGEVTLTPTSDTACMLSPGQEHSGRVGRLSRRFEPPNLQNKRQQHSRFVLEVGLFAPAGISRCRGL